MSESKFSNTVRNLRLVMFESVITSGLISMSIMTPFFYSIGMNNAEIALSQALFTVVVLLLDLPMGWLADRLSRKWANVLGDLGCGLGHLLYATVHGFAGAVFCECWLGIFLALSQGVDFTLLRHFSQKIDSGEGYFRRQSARLSFWKHACSLGLVLLGGPLGAINFRLAIALSGVPYFAGALASLLVEDDSEKLQSSQTNPFQDLFRIIKSALYNPRLRTRLFAFAVGREMTHSIIWVLTPMLLMAGVPLSIVSAAWALDNIARIIVAKLVSRHAINLSISKAFAFPLVLMTISMSVLTLKINLYTISLYLLMGIVCGWTDAALRPFIQAEAKPTEQTTILSLASALSRLLYIPASLITGWAADFQIRYATLATLLIFLPLGLAVLWRLHRE